MQNASLALVSKHTMRFLRGEASLKCGPMAGTYVCFRQS